MSVKQITRSWFFLFAFGVIAACGIFLFIRIGGTDKTFPPLPMGAYFGSVSGLSKSDAQPTTLYIERIANTNALLVVVFADGWKPQVVPMERRFDEVTDPQKTLTEDVALAPIKIQKDVVSYELTGVKTFDGFRGELSANNGSRGTWFVKPARSDVLNQNASILKERMPDLQEWLVIRTQYVEAQQTREALTERLSSLRAKHNKLKSFVDDKENLKNRARARQQALEKQLNELKEKRESSINEVKRLVSELDLLRRITKRGKAVDLARRLTAREEKWYRANWKAAEDASVLEELVTSSSSVNLAQLDAQYRKARQRRSLLLEAEAERRRIAELQHRLRRGDEASAETTERPDEQERGENKSIWNRLWGRIK